MEDYFEYKDPFAGTLRAIGIMFIIMVVILGILGYIGYSESSNACEKFGGKLSGQMNCIKNGVSYQLETKGIWTLEKQVVRKAVDINDAYSELDE